MRVASQSRATPPSPARLAAKFQPAWASADARISISTSGLIVTTRYAIVSAAVIANQVGQSEVLTYKPDPVVDGRPRQFEQRVAGALVRIAHRRVNLAGLGKSLCALLIR